MPENTNGRVADWFGFIFLLVSKSPDGKRFPPLIKTCYTSGVISALPSFKNKCLTRGLLHMNDGWLTYPHKSSPHDAAASGAGTPECSTCTPKAAPTPSSQQQGSWTLRSWRSPLGSWGRWRLHRAGGHRPAGEWSMGHTLGAHCYTEIGNGVQRVLWFFCPCILLLRSSCVVKSYMGGYINFAIPTVTTVIKSEYF